MWPYCYWEHTPCCKEYFLKASIKIFSICLRVSPRTLFIRKSTAAYFYHPLLLRLHNSCCLVVLLKKQVKLFNACLYKCVLCQQHVILILFYHPLLLQPQHWSERSHFFLDAQASLAPTHVSLSVRWSVILLNFHTIRVSGCST